MQDPTKLENKAVCGPYSHCGTFGGGTAQEEPNPEQNEPETETVDAE